MSQELRMAIIIDGNGQAAIGAFDATTNSMGRMTNAADVVKQRAGGAGKAVADAGKQVEASGRDIDAAAKRWSRAGVIIGSAIASVAVAYTALTARAINNADRLDEMSQRLSVSTETLSGWGFAAQRSGSSLETLGGAVEKFNKNVAAAVDGDSKMGKLFGALDIDVVDKTTGKLRDIEQLLPEVADKFKALQDPTLETALAMQLFGRSGGELMEFLNRGSDGIDSLTERARELGIVIDGDTAAAAAAFKDQVDDLQAGMTGLATQVAAQLLPSMTALTAEFTDFASDGERVAEVVNGVSNVMEVLGGAVEFVTPLFRAVDDAIQGSTMALQGWLHAAEGVINLDWDQVMRGVNLTRYGTVTAALGSDTANAWNAGGMGEQPRAKPTTRPQVNLIDPAELLAQDRRRVADIKAQREESRRLMALLGDEDGKLAKGQRQAAAEARKHDAELKRQQETLKRYTDQAALAAAELDGPLSAATMKHQQRVAELDAELAAHNITQAAYTALVKAAGAELEKTTLALEKRQAAPERLLASMGQELELLRLTGREREIQYRQLQAEEDMRRAIAEAMEHGAKISADRQRSLVEEARAMAEFSVAAEESAADAEDWANAWMDGVSSAADALTDFAMSGLRDFESLGDGLVASAKRIVGNLIRTFLEQKIVVPIQTRITEAIGSGSGGLGGMFESIMGLFRGNGFAGAGQTGGNLAGLLSGGKGNLFSNIAGMFGGGGGAAAPGSLYGFGNNLGNFMGMAGGSGAASAAGGAAGALGSVASFMPWAALIMAGMKMAGSAYKDGFGLQYQDKGDLLLRGNLMTGGLATPLMLDSMSLDKIGRMLGMSSKTAAIFSGSSLLGKAFGRSAPRITGQGIAGTYGFGGFDGSSWADVKQKGGWFRSDKRWTQWGAINGDIDSAFDSAIEQVGRGVNSLAERMGLDISAKLANVKVNIGKMQLDADPEKARQQLEKAVNDMIENLTKQAIIALGFNRLLDDGFPAVEVMTALSNALTLVTGSADTLGRTLQGWEIENVSRAVEYFMGLAKKNGTTLDGEVQRITGLLDNYSGLMTDVQTQLLTGGLSEYQRAALNIESTYRQQVKTANDLAKAMGLSGARAEDLAKIEQLRAVNMAKLQQQMEAERNRFLEDLSTTDLSPLTNAQKLEEAKRQFYAAAGAGDQDRAAQKLQEALGLGRSEMASGADYNRLYDELTNAFRAIGMPSLVTDDGTSMGDLAELLMSLPRQFATELFALLYNPVAAPTPAPSGGGNPGSGTTTTPPPVTGGNGQQLAAQNEGNAVLREIRDLLYRQGRNSLWAETTH